MIVFIFCNHVMIIMACSYGQLIDTDATLQALYSYDYLNFVDA